MTWETFSSFFLEKYITLTLREKRKDEFLNIDKGKIYVFPYVY